MKHWFLGLSLAAGLLLISPTVDVRASDSGSSDSGVKIAATSGGGGFGVPELDPTLAGSAMVLLLGGVAYLAHRRRDKDAA